MLILIGCTARNGIDNEVKSQSSDPSSASSYSDNESDASASLTPEDQYSVLSPSPFRMMAYLPASTSPEELSIYSESLHLLDRVTVITGLCWDKNGTICIIDEQYPALIHALHSAGVKEIYATVYPQRKLIHEGIAGTCVDTPEKREVLIDSLLAHAQEYGLHGIDLDWETPTNDQEWLFCSETIVALKQALSSENIGLSVALYPENIARLTEEARSALDILNLMTYDQFDENGFHSTYETAVSAVEKALSEGYTAQQIMLGIPAYGRPTDASAFWPLYRDSDLSESEDVLGDISYNSVATVKKKGEFAKERELGGIFLFHLTGDLPADDPLSLLRAAIEVAA